MNLQLKSLLVSGCGPFQKDTLLNFCDASGGPRPVTILGGANGSGKTTVLELITALCELLHPDYKRKDNVLSRAGYAQLDLRIDEKAFSIFYGDFTTSPALFINIPSDKYTWEAEHYGLYRSPISASFEKVISGALAIQISDSIYKQESTTLDFAFADVQQALAQQNRSTPLPGIVYLPYLRNLAPVKGQQIERAETRYQWVYRYEVARTFKGSLDSYLVWLDYAQPETFRAVCDFLNSLNFDDKTFHVERPTLKAIVATRDGHVHDVNQLSSGEQNILITLLELRRRLIPGSLVLIDEIENSLHPAFQHKLAQGLLRLQAQIPFQLIVTTHAPLFVEIFGAENTLLLTDF